MAVPRHLLLLVEDDAPLRRSLLLLLADEGFGTLEAPTGEAGLRQLDAGPDAVLLDLGLPDIDGLELCGLLRQRTAAPIVVLSGRRSRGDPDRALAAGADDFFIKPFPTGELAERLRALLTPVPAPPWSGGRLALDLQRHGLVRDGELVPLSTTELRLLAELGARPGALLEQDALLRRVWGVPPVAGAAALEARMESLRVKLQGIATIASGEAGYGLESDQGR